MDIKLAAEITRDIVISLISSHKLSYHTGSSNEHRYDEFNQYAITTTSKAYKEIFQAVSSCLAEADTRESKE